MYVQTHKSDKLVKATLGQELRIRKYLYSAD